MQEFIYFIWNNPNVIIVQFLFALVYFFLIAWIGSKSYGLGYTSISLFVQEDDALGFNFVFRVLSPIIYLILISSMLQYLKLNEYIINIYLVSVFYILQKFIFIIFSGRIRLVNWLKEICFNFFIIFFSYYIYKWISFNNVNLLPDITNLTNEIWLVVLFFIYELFNRLKPSQDTTQSRINNYIFNRFKVFRKKYCKIVDEKSSNDSIKSLVYSIMIYENFNRYKVARWMEKIAFLFKSSKTLGIMQFKTDKLINDKESVQLGIEKIVDKYSEILKRDGIDNEIEIDYYKHRQIIAELIEDYNSGDDYYNNIQTIYELLCQKYFIKGSYEFYDKNMRSDVKKDEKKK